MTTENVTFNQSPLITVNERPLSHVNRMVLVFGDWT